MKEYKLIHHYIPTEFARLASDAIEEGWKEDGMVSTSSVLKDGGGYQTIYLQKFIR